MKETIEKYSDTEIRITTPQPALEEIVPLAGLEQQLANAVADRDYLTKDYQAKLAVKDSAIASVQSRIDQAARLGVTAPDPLPEEAPVAEAADPLPEDAPAADAASLE